MQPLAPVEIHLYASPTYLARRGHPRALGEQAHEWVLFRGALQKLAIPARRARVVCDDFFFLRELLRAGGGIGPLPTFLGEPMVAAGELARVLPAFRLRQGGFVLLYPSQGKLPRKVSAFRDVLLEWRWGNAAAIPSAQ